MECKTCKKICTKSGRQKSGVQRWFCKKCTTTQQENYVYQAYKTGVKSLVIRCLKDGCGLKSTQRITSVAVSTQLRWIRLLGTEICMPLVQYKSGDSFEVDELRTFVGSKKRETWVISAKSRNTGKIVCVKVGRRNKKKSTRSN